MGTNKSNKLFIILGVVHIIVAIGLFIYMGKGLSSTEYLIANNEADANNVLSIAKTLSTVVSILLAYCGFMYLGFSKKIK